MATWVIEAANSLQATGAKVTIAVAPGYEQLVPAETDFFIVDAFKTPGNSLIKKIWDRGIFYLRYLWPRKGDTLAGLRILKLAKEKNLIFDIVLWNQTNLLCPEYPYSQWVVGWAYPANLKGYLAKLNTPSTTAYLQRIREFIYWYRTDNWAYRKASGVLCVTNALTKSLLTYNINAIYAPPGTDNHEKNIEKNKTNIAGLPHLIIAARWLDEPRKNVYWMIEALASIPQHLYTLSLIGEAAEDFINLVRGKIPSGQFLGVLSRKQLMDQMANGDILLFGSALDDWGFVQVEAMATGLAVFAPMQMPCIEIIPDPFFLFEPDNKKDFSDRLYTLLQNPTQLFLAKDSFYKTFSQKFSRKAFARQLLLTAYNSQI